MPSVEMRRNTRVFGARVLRSGRRLWSGPAEEAKYIREGDDGQDWIELFDDPSEDFPGNRKDNGIGLNQETFDEMEIDEKRKPVPGESGKLGMVVDTHVKGDRRWGIVYSRKRKRMDFKNIDISVSSSVDRLYGKTYFRKRLKKKIRTDAKPDAEELKSEYGEQNASRNLYSSRGLACFVASHCGSMHLFSSFLNLILRYMRCRRVKLAQLSAFLLSKPIVHVYSSHGIQFLQDSTGSACSGFCRFMGSKDSIPFFTVDFNAIPSSFMHLHLCLLLKSALHPHLLMIHAMYKELGNSMRFPTEDQQPSISCQFDQAFGRVILEEEQSSCISFKTDHLPSEINTIPSGKSVKKKLGKKKSGKKKSVTFSAPNLGVRTMQLRSGVITRSIQKSRNSTRAKRRRIPSRAASRKAKGAMVINALPRQDPMMAVKPKFEKLSSLEKSSEPNFKQLSFSSVALNVDLESASCSADILVIDSDRCHREAGATITLEYSDAQQWFLVVKINGIRRFMFQAQKFMRPCCVNRITHAIIWTDGDGWKLEFPNRPDWNVFKELYKKCSERSVRTPRPAPRIPVPGVSEVLGYADSETVNFRLPDSYITLKGDEVGRALEKRYPIYDMDSDDEEWLNRANCEFRIENETDKRISEDTFETIIDTFERGIFLARDDYTKFEVVADQCHELATREVLEAVHSYWMSKRQKRSGALIRMFKVYERRKAEVLPKAIFRKKRSFKRQRSQVRRGKQLAFLKAIATGTEVVQAQNVSMKVEEANNAARRSEEVAIQKRYRAQILMETADLANYKAIMALQIAEATALATESLDPIETIQFVLNE